MANADDPRADAASDITSEPKKDDDRIDLPPISTTPTVPSAINQGPIRTLDFLLIGLLLLLTFLCASIPITTTNHLMHLATGRAIVNGEYTFGQAPFTFGSEGVYWTNHSWLYDTLTYLIYQAAGAPGLIIVKALLLALLAWVLVRVGQHLVSWQIPLVLTLIGVLAMSTRFLLSPMFISFLFLGLTFYFLQRGSHRLYVRGQEEEEPSEQQTRRSEEKVSIKNYWPVLVLFAVWANMDQWFILGPLVVFLTFIGRMLQDTLGADVGDGREPRPGEVRALGVLFVSGVVACLLNPHHIHVFELPVLLGFSSMSEYLQQNRSIQSLFWTPFTSAYLRFEGITIAGLSYFLLILVSLFSFVMNLRQWNWSRLLLWLTFLVLSLFRAQLIPFFTVVAVPIAALNIQETILRLHRQRYGTEPMQRAPGGRVITVMIILVLLGASISGKLHYSGKSNYQSYRHRVAFVEEIAPPLIKAVQRVKALEEKGAIAKDSRWLNLSPAVANVMAWNCPSQKTFFDYRFEAFPETIKEIQEINLGLMADLSNSPRTGRFVEQPRIAKKWRAYLDKHKVDYVALYEPVSPIEQNWRLMKFVLPEKKWSLIYFNGQTALLVPPGEESQALKPELTSLERMGLLPEKDQRAPWTGPEIAQTEPSIWKSLFHAEAPLPPETAETALLLDHFDKLKTEQANRRGTAWRWTRGAHCVGSLVPFGALPTNLFPVEVTLGYFELRRRSNLAGRTVPIQPKTPAEQLALGEVQRYLNTMPRESLYHLPLLAVRSSRRALGKNPNSPLAYLKLADSYRQLHYRTREQYWRQSVNLLIEARFIQQVSALAKVIELDPDNRQAHEQLAELYASRNFLDLQVKHQTKALELLKKQGPPEGTAVEFFQNRVKAGETQLTQVQQRLATAKNQFQTIASQIVQPLPKAQTAARHGLAEEALNILLSQDVSAFGAQGATLELRLFLQMGRIYEIVWDEMDDKFEQLIGTANFHELRFLRAVALGDYEAADKHQQALQAETLDPSHLHRQLLTARILSPDQKKTPTVYEGMSLLIVKTIVDGLNQNSTIYNNHTVLLTRRAYNEIISATLRQLDAEAILRVQRAIFLLEAGRHEEAEKLLTSAVDLAAKHKVFFPALPVAEDILYLIQLAKE